MFICLSLTITVSRYVSDCQWKIQRSVNNFAWKQIFISFIVKSVYVHLSNFVRLSRPTVYSYTYDKLKPAVKTVDRRFSLLSDARISPVFSVERIDGVNCLWFVQASALCIIFPRRQRVEHRPTNRRNVFQSLKNRQIEATVLFLLAGERFSVWRGFVPWYHVVSDIWYRRDRLFRVKELPISLFIHCLWRVSKGAGVVDV